MYNMSTYTLPLSEANATGGSANVSVTDLSGTPINGVTLAVSNFYDAESASDSLFTYTTNASGDVISYHMNHGKLVNLANISGLDGAATNGNTEGPLIDDYIQHLSSALFDGSSSYIENHWPAFVTPTYPDYVTSISDGLSIDASGYVELYNNLGDIGKSILAEDFYNRSQEASAFTPEVDGTFGVPLAAAQTIALPLSININPNQSNLGSSDVSDVSSIEPLSYILILTLTA